MMFFLWRIFVILREKNSKKKCDKFPVFFKKIRQKTKNIQKFVKNHHSCQQYERVLKILYFDILNFAKFG